MTMKNISNFGFVAIFFLIIVVIFGNNFAHVFSDGISTEKRALAVCQDITKSKQERIIEYTSRIFNGVKDFEKCFDDNLSFRNYIISLTNYAKVRYFGLSPASNIVKGVDDWYFYNEPGIVQTYSGQRQYSQDEKAKLKDLITKRVAFMKAQNIEYVQIVVPNKLTMYSEYLPKSIVKLNQETALVQYSNIAQSIPNFNFYNLKDSLFEVKQKNQIFYKTDSHWNHTGILYAYDKLTKQLEGKISLKPSASFQKLIKNHSGDLSFFMNTLDYIKDFDQTFYKIANPTAANQNLYPTPITLDGFKDKLFYEKWENPDKSLPKAIIIGDSYTDEMRPFLAENFSEMTYYKATNDFVYTEIIKSKPDVVIQIFNESQLVSLPNN
jgi:alginate O-acetyltransferase complex protein AlgJ